MLRRYVCEKGCVKSSAERQDDGTPLTLFIFDGTLPPLQPGNKDRRALMQLARNTLKKLKTIRHPDVYVVPASWNVSPGRPVNGVDR